MRGRWRRRGGFSPRSRRRGVRRRRARQRHAFRLDEVAGVVGDLVELVLEGGMRILAFRKATAEPSTRSSAACGRLPSEALCATHAHAGQAAAIMLLARPPFPTCLNILAICAYWRRSWFTSCTLVPEAGGDALAARAGDDFVVAVFRGVMELMMASRRTNCFSSTWLCGLLHAGERADVGQHLQNPFHRAELFDLPDLFAEVFEREAVAEKSFLGEIFGFPAVERFLSLFNEREHVAHAQDAADNSIRDEMARRRRAFRPRR